MTPGARVLHKPPGYFNTTLTNGLLMELKLQYKYRCTDGLLFGPMLPVLMAPWAARTSYPSVLWRVDTTAFNINPKRHVPCRAAFLRHSFPDPPPRNVSTLLTIFLKSREHYTLSTIFYVTNRNSISHHSIAPRRFTHIH